jgi:predicted ester cyclase
MVATTVLTNSEMKARFRLIPEVIFNTGSVDVADEIMERDYVEHIPMPPGCTPDRDGFKKFVGMWRAALPDLHYTVTRFTDEDLIGEGDRVVHRLVGEGTHAGDFLGIPPTGNRVVWTETHIGRFENGKLVEHWGQIDVLQILQQLGVLPGPGAEPSPTPAPPAVDRGAVGSPDDNKAVMCRLIEDVWNRGELDLLDELFHPEATSPSAPALPPGPAGVREIVRMFRTAFPDFHMTIDDMIAEDAFVAGRFTETGTHLGEFMGVAPTGKRVGFGEVAILRMVANRIVESWYDVDMLGMLRQLGLGAVGVGEGT